MRNFGIRCNGARSVSAVGTFHTWVGKTPSNRAAAAPLTTRKSSTGLRVTVADLRGVAEIVMAVGRASTRALVEASTDQ
jgi:hypothetical protein